MPRSRGRSSGPAPSRAPSRPTAAPARPAAPQQQQTRPATTTAYPSQPKAGQAAGVPQQQQGRQGPGLFGQMASTAAGVAVGSSIGHAVGGMFGGWGGSSETPAQQQEQQQPIDAYSQPTNSQMYGTQSQSAANYSAEAGPCARDIKTFTQCMTENNGNMNICGWYLEQLKACQQASQQY